jgi:hypothetical protein
MSVRLQGSLLAALMMMPQPLVAQVPLDKPATREEVAEGARKDLPRQKPSMPRKPAGRPVASTADNLSACLKALGGIGARVRVLHDNEAPGRCGMTGPVVLSAIKGVQVTPEAELSCRTALAFATFAATRLFPLARETLSSPVATVRVAGAYECRGRNRQTGARLSEHAFGRAIDVRGLVLENGERWRVRPLAAGDDSAGARFQRALRSAACGPFSTVLGPGSDAHHDDHLHLDTKPRRAPYCR